MRPYLVFCGALALFLMLAASGMAAGGEMMEMAVDSPHSITPSTTKGFYYNMNEYELRTRKLCRGLANVGLCVAEIPNQMFREAYRSSPISGAVVGAWKGVVMGGKRLAIGMWEIATFYAPTKNNYQPYIEPEVVMLDYMH